MTYLTMYWLQILILLGTVTIGAGGFYLHKKYKESHYKHEIEDNHAIYILCVNDAVTAEDYQKCWKQREEGK